MSREDFTWIDFTSGAINSDEKDFSKLRSAVYRQHPYAVKVKESKRKILVKIDVNPLTKEVSILP